MDLRPGPVARLVAAVACLAVLGACGDPQPAPGPAAPAPAAEGEYLPGLAAVTDLPDAEPAAVVVLVPGGGWSSADPTGLAPLARSLVDAGLAVVTITYGTSGSASAYPEPADDVACAVAYAAGEVPDVPVVAVGHSAGAHLAVLVGLAPDRAGAAGEGDPEEPADVGSCPHEPHPADGVVGLAGPYDVTRTGGMAEQLFGGTQAEAPEAWAEGNPHTWADARPDLPVLLVHGDEDDVVPPWFTTSLADDLTAGGHDVRVELLPGVDHMEVIRPEVVAGLVEGWVRDVVLRP